MTRPSVFTIPAGADFAQALAQGLLDRLGGDALKLSSATIYLPTRRATRSFGEAFAQATGGATLLPQFKALGESDEDELLFDAASEGLELLPAIAPLRRQLLLAREIRQWDRGHALSFAQAAALADSLAKVMDEVETQGCDLGKLKDHLPAELAAHWEGVTRFLDVLHQQWPAILAEERKLNPAARRNQALRALAQRLAVSPPGGFVIAAGSTGSIPATAELLGAIARLPQGAVVLPGLDRGLDDDSWQRLDEGHPQFGLRLLLKTMGCERQDVRDWAATDHNAPRAALLRETLRPAPTTDAWRALAEKGAGEIAAGLDGIGLIAAADPAQEALAIALALRHALEEPDRTAALVTPDRNLARRVAAEMARWNVALDDSAGRPLAHTTAGAFLCLVVEAAQARFAPVPLLALLKHPFATRGQDGAAFRARARELDRWCLRGPRPDAGLAGIAAAIQNAKFARRAPPAEALDALAAWWADIAAIFAPLETLFAKDAVTMEVLLEAHGAAAEALACGESGDCALWQKSDGETAFELVAGLRLAAQNLPPIEPGSWPHLFRSLAMKAPVRGAFGQHPRLAILGPLEARMQRFDLTILGGLNEGTWPGAAGHDPWFSRPLRTSLGLEQPERSIGLSAHDFAMLAAGPNVILSRSLKADGAPTVASRWLQRLEQLTHGLGLGVTNPCDYVRLAAQLSEVAQGPRLPRPAPTPPVDMRPRRLSVTEIETWLRDPYAIYARHVLKLEPLKALDEAIGPLERGTALHKALELFIQQFPGELPDDAAQRLAAIADGVFAELGIPHAALAVWRPRFFEAAQGFIAVERARRAGILRSHTEVAGKMMLGDFELRGVADRIDELQDGSCAILDYKSGAVPTIKQVEQFLSPQLPLEAAILADGGFTALGKRIAQELIYLSLADGRKARKPLPLPDPQDLAVEAVARLRQRIAQFNDAATPYYSRVRPFREDSAGDYDHLARVREWSAVAEES